MRYPPLAQQADTKPSQTRFMVGHQRPPVPSIVRNTAIFRLLSLTACLSWGILEFFALQKSRLLRRRGQV
jgi:hypothetical protein